MWASRPRAWVAALAALVLACTGCGRPPAVSRDGRLEIGLNEYRITPPQSRGATGTLTIVVRNYGRLTHNLVISRDGLTQAATNPIAPGGASQLVVALAPGQYRLASTILSDQALGAYGTLRIR